MMNIRMPFAQRIGLSVSHELVSAVVARDGDVEWSAAERVGEEDELGDAITRLLRKLPPLRWPRPRVSVAIDDPRSRVKTIRGLPPVTDSRTIARVIAATPERFFLSATQGVVTTGARVAAPGIADAAAFDTALITDINAACDAMGYPVACFTPASVALAAAQTADITRGGAHDIATEDPEDLTRSFTVARGATLLARDEPIVSRPARHSLRPDLPASTRVRQRLSIAGLAAVTSIGVALLTPTLIAIHTTTGARHVIATLAPLRTKTLLAQREADHMAISIAAVTTFEQQRLSKTLLLSQLTAALPSMAAITMLRIDTAGITVVVLAPRAAAAVQRIEEIPGTSHVEMVGPVTHESGGNSVNAAAGATQVGQGMERVTIHFRLASDGMSSRTALVADTHDRDGATP